MNIQSREVFYAVCERCGSESTPSIDPEGAKRRARAEGFVEERGLTLCKECRESAAKSRLQAKA